LRILRPRLCLGDGTAQRLCLFFETLDALTAHRGFFQSRVSKERQSLSAVPSQAEPGTERDELYIHMEQGNETLTTYHAGE
jgi:hypothetical protein